MGKEAHSWIAARWRTDLCRRRGPLRVSLFLHRRKSCHEALTSVSLVECVTASLASFLRLFLFRPSCTQNYVCIRASQRHGLAHPGMHGVSHTSTTLFEPWTLLNHAAPHG